LDDLFKQPAQHGKARRRRHITKLKDPKGEIASERQR
jgi:hypothetical protein